VKVLNTHSNCVLFIQGDAVRMITENRAPKIVQPTEGATYDAMLKKTLVEVCQMSGYEF